MRFAGSTATTRTVDDVLAVNEVSIADLDEDTPKKFDWDAKLYAKLPEQSPDLDPTPDLEPDSAMNTGGGSGRLDMPLECGNGGGGKGGEGGSA